MADEITPNQNIDGPTPPMPAGSASINGTEGAPTPPPIHSSSPSAPPSPLGDASNSQDIRPPQKVPSPPPPPITVRTMASDIQSMKDSGGSPVPEKIKQSDLRVKDFNPSDDEPLFTPDSSPGLIENEGGLPAWVKTTGIIIGAVIVLAGLGAAGYYWVYPLVFQQQESTPVITDQSSTSTIQDTSPSTATHTSFFKTPADEVETVSINNLTAVNIVQVLNSSASNASEGTIIKEVSITQNNIPVESSQILSTIFPTLSENDLSRNFDRDLTTFLFFNESGAWSGYIFKLKENALLIDAQGIIRSIEDADASEIKNMFLSDPGDITSDGFLVGQVNGSPARYVVFESDGAALDYAWLNDGVNQYLLFGTQYDGAKAAASLLGI